MLHLGQPVFNDIFVADAIKDVTEIMNVTGAIGELNSVVCQYDIDCVRNRFDQIAQELGCRHLAGFLVQFDIGKLGCPADGDEEVEFALCGLNLSNINVEIADGISFEFLLGRFVTLDLWQPGNAMTL